MFRFEYVQKAMLFLPKQTEIKQKMCDYNAHI